ncbi:hypothetical protein [Oceanobacillus indicireducens]|uniref:Uncharacterized protein n=1 Tax=Oceanobacillus indicireducens TaxID=1004261 RepID=A0A917Y1K7_9BACI|nr:hypothetical protein [Oceanobacillus indicireducens]GGN62503.1 hypothetical protein GCM10007971_28500 [Oceanobacillus indicireducens]
MKDSLIVVLSIVVVTYIIYKNRIKLKELTKFQILGTGFTYLAVACIGGFIIYYGGNWVAGKMPNLFFKYIIFLVVICITLYLCVSVLHKLLRKITSGKLPTNNHDC